MTDTKTPIKRTSSAASGKVWSDEERSAMQEGSRERKATSRRNPADERAEGERDLREKIAGMPEPDRAMAERVDAIVMAAAPDLAPKTYYGMPAYAKNGKVICFFKPKSKFKVRYSTFEFGADARLDEGAMWPVSFALTELTPATEARIVGLVKKAAG
jgi:uncharacterized protein YdhG (YjbR/CyaY superfamily)